MPKFTQAMPKETKDDELALKQHLLFLQKTIDLKNEVNFDALSIEMPYAFISLQAMYDTLLYYKNNSTKPIRFGFKCFENVYDFYKKMLDFKKDSMAYFSKAEDIVKVQHLIAETNLNIINTKSLDNNLCVYYNEELFTLANKVLTLLPEYNQLITPEFKAVVLNSALHELPLSELTKLVDSNIIKENTFYYLKAEDDTAINKLEELKTYLESKGVVFQTEKTFNLKLKGVTFEGKDNIPRQVVIKELEEAVKENKNIALELEQYEYVPDLGIPENACRVLWEGKDIGNLSKDTVAVLNEQYKNNKVFVSLDKIVGGDNGMSYGVDINLSVQLLELQKDTKEISK